MKVMLASGDVFAIFVCHAPSCGSKLSLDLCMYIIRSITVLWFVLRSSDKRLKIKTVF